MNIFSLRNKLKASMHQPQPAAAPVAQAEPAAAPVVEAAPAPAPVPAAIAPESVGLNDLFDLDDSDIRQMSPKLTFTQFKLGYKKPEQ
jgi:hypothetical protein